MISSGKFGQKRNTDFQTGLKLGLKRKGGRGYAFYERNTARREGFGSRKELVDNRRGDT